MYDEDYGGLERQNDSPSLFWFFIVSGICHILTVAGVIFLPDILPRERIYQPSSFVVDLVAPPGPPPKAEKHTPIRKPIAAAPQPEVKKAEPEVKEPETPKPQPPPETEKPKEKEAVKKEEPLVPAEDAEISLAKKHEEAPKKVEKPKEIPKPPVAEKPKAAKTEEIDKKAQKNLQSTIDRLKKKMKGLREVEERVRDADVPESDDDEPAGGHPAGVEGGTGGGGGQIGDLPDYYVAQLRYHIEKNWSYPESLAGSQAKVQAIVNVRVSPSGEIKEVWFERRSGNKYLDESANKAVARSNPLPPPPKGYTEYVFGFIFTPKGLK